MANFETVVQLGVLYSAPNEQAMREIGKDFHDRIAEAVKDFGDSLPEGCRLVQSKQDGNLGREVEMPPVVGAGGGLPPELAQAAARAQGGGR